MKDIIMYFISKSIEATKTYFNFYLGIYRNTWNLPRVYNLTDKTLLIRLIEYTVTTLAVFSVLMYIIGYLTGHEHARASANQSLLHSMLSAYFFVYGLASVLYMANKLYPRSPVSFRECVSLLHFLFLQCFPLLVALLIALPESSSGMLKDFPLYSGLHSIVIALVCIVLFRNEMLFLQLSIVKTIFFQFSVLIVEIALVSFLTSLSGLITCSFTLIPENLQVYLFSIIEFLTGILDRLL